MAISDEADLYHPFMRYDQYGLLGKAKQSSLEKIRLLLFSIFVLPVKLICAVMCVVGCHLSCRLASLLPKHQCADMCAWTGKVWCRMALFFLGFNVRWVKAPGAESSKAKPAGIISNHSRCVWGSYWLGSVVQGSWFPPSIIQSMILGSHHPTAGLTFSSIFRDRSHPSLQKMARRTSFWLDISGWCWTRHDLPLFKPRLSHIKLLFKPLPRLCPYLPESSLFAPINCPLHAYFPSSQVIQCVYVTREKDTHSHNEV